MRPGLWWWILIKPQSHTTLLSREKWLILPQEDITTSIPAELVQKREQVPTDAGLRLSQERQPLHAQAKARSLEHPLGNLRGKDTAVKIALHWSMRLGKRDLDRQLQIQRSAIHQLQSLTVPSDYYGIVACETSAKKGSYDCRQNRSLMALHLDRASTMASLISRKLGRRLGGRW